MKAPALSCNALPICVSGVWQLEQSFFRTQNSEPEIIPLAWAIWSKRGGWQKTQTGSFWLKLAVGIYRKSFGEIQSHFWREWTNPKQCHDEARRIAANIAKLPELLAVLRHEPWDLTKSRISLESRAAAFTSFG
jgi:hypothetical protein